MNNKQITLSKFLKNSRNSQKKRKIIEIKEKKSKTKKKIKKRSRKINKNKMKLAQSYFVIKGNSLRKEWVNELKKDLKKTTKELETFKKESKQNVEFLKDLLMKAVSKPTYQPVFSPQPNFKNGNNKYPQTQQSQQPNLSPPPDVRKKQYKTQDTGNLKKDYVNEIKQIFTGAALKPSEILKTTKPKHKDEKITKINEKFKIPTIEQISTAKDFVGQSVSA